MMARTRIFDLALVVVAWSCAAVLELRQPLSGQVLVNTAFVAIMLTAMGALAQVVWRAWRRSVLTRRETTEIAGLVPDQVVATAVRLERERLMVEIDAIVRSSLSTVRARMVGIRTDAAPQRVLRLVQSDARSAMTELRRELGLLNAKPAMPARALTPAASSGPPSRDFWIGGGVMALALVETLAESSFEGLDAGMSWILPVVMAATLIGRNVAPTLAALTAAACLAVGTVSGHPVPDGLFFPLVVGLLLWRLLSIMTRANIASAVVLFAIVCISRQLHDPENLGINVAVMLFVCGASLAYGRWVRRTRQALDEAAPHRAELAAATKDAVDADRRRVAREVHDVASHAVCLIAVQAGAAEMLWDNDPEAALRAAAEIDPIASSALKDLEALRPGNPVDAVGWPDVAALIHRMRAAGLDVRLDHDGVPPAALMPTVHRVVQESLTNALRYAPASSVRVTVTTSDDELRVEVTDDGVTVPRAGHAHGFGLVGLGERVRQLGGTLTTGERADGGFSVCAVIPGQAASATGGEAIR